MKTKDIVELKIGEVNRNGQLKRLKKSGMVPVDSYVKVSSYHCSCGSCSPSADTFIVDGDGKIL